MDFTLSNIEDDHGRLGMLDAMASEWRRNAEQSTSVESVFITDCHYAMMYQAEADALRRKLNTE